MKTISISTNYNLKWQINFANEYKISTCKKIINTKTGRIVKTSLNGGYTKGYWIGRRFIPENKINNFAEIIHYINCPF